MQPRGLRNVYFRPGEGFDFVAANGHRIIVLRYEADVAARVVFPGSRTVAQDINKAVVECVFRFVKETGFRAPKCFSGPLSCSDRDD